MAGRCHTSGPVLLASADAELAPWKELSPAGSHKVCPLSNRASYLELPRLETSLLDATPHPHPTPKESALSNRDCPGAGIRKRRQTREIWHLVAGRQSGAPRPSVREWTRQRAQQFSNPCREPGRLFDACPCLAWIAGASGGAFDSRSRSAR